jgi:hypothetical protein
MCRCGDGILTGEAPGRKAARTQRCKCWGCEHCAPKNATKLRARSYAANCNRGFDLTIRHEPERTLEEETALLKATWRKFRLWWNRTYPNNKIECLTCWEVKGKRHVHLHVLARCGYVDWRVLAQFFWREIRSHRQWVKPLLNQKARIAYATKYVTKKLAKLKGTSRYSVTHGFEDPNREIPCDPFYQGMTWLPSKQCLVTWCEERAMDGWQVDWPAGSDRATARPP